MTGSNFLLTDGARRILVDAGAFQGERELRRRNWEPFPIDPSLITDVILTHAHLDHCGYLPALVRNGFHGPVWATAATIRLAEIVLRDAAHLQERDALDAAEGGWSKPVSYTHLDVYKRQAMVTIPAALTRLDAADPNGRSK